MKLTLLIALSLLSATAHADDDDASDTSEEAWSPPDPGPQYSDNSIASGIREQAATIENTADDVAAAHADAAQYAADGESDATMVQAAGAAKIVGGAADIVVAGGAMVAGPEGEEVNQLYGQAKGAAGAAVYAADDQGAEAALEGGKAIGETAGADSTTNRVVNAAAAYDDASNGEYVKAAGEATTAAGDAETGGMVSAIGNVGEGVTLIVEGGEQKDAIAEQYSSADEQMTAQEDALREQAADLNALAQQVDANVNAPADDEEDGDVDSEPAYDDTTYVELSSSDSYDSGDDE